VAPAPAETLPDPAFWAGRRVLITGHTGFKGAWLTLWLTRLGAEVTGIAGSAPGPDTLYALARCDADARTLQGDVRSLADVEAAVRAADPEVVVHLAAQATVLRSMRDPLATYVTNVIGTANVLDAVRRLGHATRALVSVTTEPLGGRDPYSSSKACQELVTAAYRASFLAERGIGVATARAGNLIGGGDWAEDRLVPDLMRAAIEGRTLVVRNPASLRPWQHVLCPLHGYLLLCERLWADPAGHGEPWNFGPAEDDARPVGWIVERLCERWPEPVTVAASPADDGTEAMALTLDSSRARARLGWTPRWGLAEGLDATAEWYLAFREEADLRALCDGQIERFAGRTAVGAGPDTV
jgi:CDP-glucose 4,6-dehydratase